MTQVAMPQRASVIQKVMEYPTPEQVVQKYIDKYDVTEAVAREHERELKRYLAMCLADPEAAYGMFGPVDEFWHTWILFTREWWDFSRDVAGRYIHHRPTTREEKQLARSGETPSAYGRFLADYPGYFGERAPAHLWPRQRGAVAEANCSWSDCFISCSAGGCSAGGCSGGVGGGGVGGGGVGGGCSGGSCSGGGS
jgi:hypothetical protein